MPTPFLPCALPACLHFGLSGTQASSQLSHPATGLCLAAASGSGALELEPCAGASTWDRGLFFNRSVTVVTESVIALGVTIH